MTNREKLKIAIEQDINPQKYYQEMVQKIDKRRKYSFWKFSLVPICFLVIISGVVLFKRNSPLENDGIFHINQLSTTDKLPNLKLDSKNLFYHDFCIPYPYKIGNPVAIPTDLNTSYHYVVDSKEKKDTQKDDNPLYYYLMVSTNGKDRFIQVAYSKEVEPFGEVFSPKETEKSTFLFGTELKMYQLENYYYVKFYYNDYYFGIETSQLTEQELSEFLISILK